MEFEEERRPCVIRRGIGKGNNRIGISTDNKQREGTTYFFRYGRENKEKRWEKLKHCKPLRSVMGITEQKLAGGGTVSIVFSGTGNAETETVLAEVLRNGEDLRIEKFQIDITKNKKRSFD